MKFSSNHTKSKANFADRYYKHSKKAKMSLTRKFDNEFKQEKRKHANLYKQLFINYQKCIMTMMKTGRIKDGSTIFDSRHISLLRKIKHKHNSRIYYYQSKNFEIKSTICKKIGYVETSKWGHPLDLRTYVGPYVMVWCKKVKQSVGGLILHRDDGPAVIWNNGKTEWWRHNSNVSKKIDEIINLHQLDNDYRNWTQAEHMIVMLALS